MIDFIGLMVFTEMVRFLRARGISGVTIDMDILIPATLLGGTKR